MTHDTCPHCGALIFLARTWPSLKPAPYDYTPVPTGNVVVRDHNGLIAMVLAPGDHRDKDQPTYKSHLLTCTQADMWRHR